MSITFNQIPLTINVPGAYVEFDASKAVRGVQQIPHNSLIIAQKLSTGSGTAGQLYQVRSADEALALGGQHSQAHQMVKAYKAVDSLTPLFLLMQADAGSSAAATGSITWTGTATEAGALVVYVSGRRVSVAVAIGDTATVLETNALAAFGQVADLPVAVAGNTGTGLDFTAKAKGTQGNDIRLGVSLSAGERVPAGIVVTVTQMASGATDVDYAAMVTAMADDQYNTIVLGNNLDANLELIATELDSRWGPTRQNEGFAFVGANDTQANLTTAGNGLNSPFVIFCGFENSALMLTPWENAARAAAESAKQAQVDPSRPLTGLPLNSPAAARGSRFTFAEQNTLLSDGVSTFQADSAGNLQIQRLITTYQTNALSLTDVALRDLPVVRTLAAMRYSLRARITSKFARFKLADNGNEVPGQPIATPHLIEGEILALFKDWQALGWVENYDQFKAELYVERDQTDQNRVNAILPPDMVNSFLVAAMQIGFRL